MNWNYGTGESIIYEVGFSSEMAPEKRDAPKLRRVPPCTPLTSRPILSPATFLISLFSQSNLLLFSLCLLIFTTTCVFIQFKRGSKMTQVKSRGVLYRLRLGFFFFFVNPPWFSLLSKYIISIYIYYINILFDES